jgi:hypothetical protein
MVIKFLKRQGLLDEALYYISRHLDIEEERDIVLAWLKYRANDLPTLTTLFPFELTLEGSLFWYRLDAEYAKLYNSKINKFRRWLKSKLKVLLEY